MPILKCHLQGNFLRLNSSSNLLVSRKMIPYSRPKLSDFYTLFESKLAVNHTLHSGTYLYSSYMGVPPTPPPGVKFSSNDTFWILLFLLYSFGVEKTNTFIRSRGSLVNHTRFKTIMVKIYTHFQTKTAQKPYPLGRHKPIQLI